MEHVRHESPAQPRDRLSVLRSVESTPPGDFGWAKHCTRQQAAILLLSTGAASFTHLDQLATAADIRIESVPAMPFAGMYLPYRDGWRICISDSLTARQQLRAAVHQLKHLIDHPIRVCTESAVLSEADFESLAGLFADLILGNDSEPSTFHHQLSGKEISS